MFCFCWVDNYLLAELDTEEDSIYKAIVLLNLLKLENVSEFKCYI